MNALKIFLAVILFLFGLVTLLLPLPIGLPLMIVSLAILLKQSKTAKMLMRMARRHSSRLDKILRIVERHAPRFAASVLRQTRPVVKRKLKSSRPFAPQVRPRA